MWFTTLNCCLGYSVFKKSIEAAHTDVIGLKCVCCHCCCWCIQWHRDRGNRGQLPPPPKFSLLGNASSENFLQKYKLRGWKFPIFGEFRAELKILSTVNLVEICRWLLKNCNFLSPQFLNSQNAGGYICQHFLSVIRSDDEMVVETACVCRRLLDVPSPRLMSWVK